MSSGFVLFSSDDISSVFVAGVLGGETCRFSDALDVRAIFPGLAVVRRFSGGLEVCWVEEAEDSKAAARSRSPSGSSSSPSDVIGLSPEKVICDSDTRGRAFPCALSHRPLGIVVLTLLLRGCLVELPDTSLCAISGTD